MQSRYGRAVLALAATVGLLSGCATDTPDGEPRPDDTPPNTEPDASGVLWRGDAETGDLSQFQETPWNVHGGAPAPEIVADAPFVRDGEYAIGFTIFEESDGEGLTSGARTELVPDTVNFNEGDEYWFGFSTYLGEDFPVDESWQVVTQWKNEGEGSPPIEFSVGGGEFRVGGGSSHPDGLDPFQESLGPAPTEQWVDWTFRIHFSTDDDEAEIEVWRDDELVLPTFQPESGTLYPPVDEDDVPDEAQSYLKTGYYRNGDISAPGTIYFDNWTLGISADSVR